MLTLYLLDFFEEYHISIDGKSLKNTDKMDKKNIGIYIITIWAFE